MKKIVKLAVFLGIICVISSAALYFTNSITAPVIAKNQKDATDKLLKEIVSNADDFKAEEIKDGSIVNVYFAKKGNDTVATVYELSTYGFQSDIKVLISINKAGKYSGFQVIEQAETPGYGTQVQTSTAYQKQFTTKSVDDEIDIITGSTVSTSALKAAIEEAVAHYKANNK
ncbi:electron transport complex protein RnfG [Bacilli bacterium PM5-3]|nr:electron transport complex protein RnfG [Bacilli bacterium PM5-3]MDH6603884.1 electron transport complex protein RnfG [Bacilli bacterium PM5-9]